MEVIFLYGKVRPGTDKKIGGSFGSLQVVNLSYDNIAVPEYRFFVCWKLQYSNRSSSLCVVWAGALNTKDQNGYRTDYIGYSGLDFDIQSMQEAVKVQNLVNSIKGECNNVIIPEEEVY